MATVMRVLQGSVVELFTSEAGHVNATPIEKLARTQSLFLYQIIRMFDGDVLLRTQSEKDMPLLQTWLNELCRIRNQLRHLYETDIRQERRQTPKIEWEVGG